MTTITHSAAARGALSKSVARVHVTVPASKSVRAAVLADFRKTHGLDVSDDDRANRVRARARAKRA